MSDKVVQQKSIVNTNLFDFDEEIGRHLKDGWRIVPGSVVMMSVPGNGQADERYFAVVEI